MTAAPSLPVGQRIRQYLLPSAIALLLAAGLPFAGAQQGDEPDVRVRGVIDKDQTWSGLVWITGDTNIEQATVRVAPGTVIEFAQAAAGDHPTLTIGAPGARGGRLKLEAAADKPITLRTRPGTAAGCIMLYAAEQVVWQHLVMEGLGYIDSRPGPKSSVKVQQSAVQVRLSGNKGGFELADASLRACGRVDISAPQGAEVKLRRSRFAEPIDRASIVVDGADAGGEDGPGVLVSDNRLSAAIIVRGRSSQIEQNVIIGEDAAVVIEGDTSSRTVVRGNYIHNTTSQDDGRYCAKCENPSATIERNIFRGGTTCLLGGSRRMSRNLFIAAPKLASRTVKSARTHTLVQGLPAGAEFSENVLLGPAHTLLIPQPSLAAGNAEGRAGAIVVRNNVFDGLVESNRAIQLNAPGCAPARVEIFDNLFLRTPCLVFDAARSPDTLAFADYNAVAPPAPRAYDRARLADGAACGAHDLTRDDVAALRLTHTPPEKAPEFDRDLMDGRRSVEEVRLAVFAAFAPAAGSPLRGAARPREGGASPGVIGLGMEPDK